MLNNNTKEPEATSSNWAKVIPRVVKFAYGEFSCQRGKWTAQCNHCKKYLSDKEGVTTSFTK